ncbi:HipA N-terminal domain-containing protein [Phaeobacter italicus]|uniref:HipA N-terminal domain-containing protein n=1 Tax=Phaeobacter italicus TaxID=481446 RepID=UPI00248D7129|nr:HipA N-terminal domain-containing protein [Phaeobacter italicus]
MGRRRAYAPLDVYMNGRRVGQYFRAPDGAFAFTYAPEWLSWENTLPISRALHLRPERYTGPPVVAVFENLLPDSDLIRRRVAERVGADGVDAYSLLARIGRDCVGALQFLPEGEQPGNARALTGEPLSDAQIGVMLQDLAQTPLGIRSEQDFRISVAGAQEKTALLFHEGQWVLPTGTTPTTHILKPAIGRLPNGMDLTDSIENEHFCLRLLAGFGLPVARTEIADFAGTRALVIERFDRLRARDGEVVRALVERVLIAPRHLTIQLSGTGMARALGIAPGSIEPDKLRIETGFELRRRGVEIKIITGQFERAPDQTLINAIAKARQWMSETRRGISLAAIGRRYGWTDSPVRQRIRLAFLSPEITAAILDGRQPPELTLQYLLTHPIALDWHEQARTLGFIDGKILCSAK